MKNSAILFSIFLIASISAKCQENSESIVWVDPAHDPQASQQTVVVWFEDQFLEHGDSYLKKVEKLKGKSRSVLRKEIILALQHRSDQSFSKIENQLNALAKSKHITDVKQHWIINGFTCIVKADGFHFLMNLEGVSKIFIKKSRPNSNGTNVGPEFIETIPDNRFNLQEVSAYPWNIEKIRAPEVWRKLGYTGKGTLNVVHDSGFKLDIPPLAETIYTNDDEIPGNGIDDDDNGYVDDYHGYNFDTQQANLNEPTIRRKVNIHGNLCAAIISGTFETDTKQAIGIAPDSKWSPIIGATNIEQAVEWAIEQGADTYSMSFSHPNLGEYKTHWRKVLEHGTLCGVVFISGAGNFASGPRAAPIPIQMRNPEDIPNVVLGVAGVGEDGERPAFSSQGPVEWQSHYYKDGKVDKPDFTTINYKVHCVDPEGKLEAMASGNSLAGPHMAGIVSLMLSANPELNPWQVRDILIKVAQDIGSQGFDHQTGHGWVNAYDAVKAAIDY